MRHQCGAARMAVWPCDCQAAPRCEGSARGAWRYPCRFRPRAARRGDAPCAPRAPCAARRGAPLPCRGLKPTTTPGAPVVKCRQQAVPAAQEQQRTGYLTRRRLRALRALRASSHLGPPAPGSGQLPSGQLMRQPLLACETAEPSSVHPPHPHGNVQLPPRGKPHRTPPPLLAQPPPPRALPQRQQVGAPGGRHDALGLHCCKEGTGPSPPQRTAHQCTSPARLKQDDRQRCAHPTRPA